MKRILLRATEGEPVRLPPELYDPLSREGDRVARELRLSFGGVTRLAGSLRFDNMIGTIATRDVALELAPKTKPGQNWTQAVLELLGNRPRAIFDNVSASESSPNATFREIIARAYALRLSAALAIEGPITTIETVFDRSPLLSGRLRVAQWIQRAAYDGHRFPVDHQVLTITNAYSETLAFVGQILAPAISDPRIRRQLLETVDSLSGGREVHSSPANAVGLELPEQWGAYEPAWVLAQMVLRNQSSFGDRAKPYGISLVIEPWILLETLLERSLDYLARQLSLSGRPALSRPQRDTKFLIGRITEQRHRYLVPDCLLQVDGFNFANFEAKYRDYTRSNGPLRGESYQAITAGRALGTQIAVLVYPNAIPTNSFQILQNGHPPQQLAVLGLDLFSYRCGLGERERAEWISKLLENATGTAMLSGKGEVA